MIMNLLFIAENSSQYNRAYYKITEILLDNPLLQKNNLKLLGLAEAPGNFIRYIKNIIHSTNPSWDNYDIITLLTHDELVSQQNFLTNLILKYLNQINHLMETSLIQKILIYIYNPIHLKLILLLLMVVSDTRY